MTGDSVGRLSVRWRPDAEPGPDGRSRLDGLLGGLLEQGLPDGLGAGLADVGSAAGGAQVCVRQVALAPHRMRWGTVDGELVAGWGRAVELAVARAVALGGPDVVRYRSRASARAELVTAVLGGDVDRAWAWRLLGLWPAGPAPQGDDVVRRVLGDMARGTAGDEAGDAAGDAPHAVVGLLLTVARGGQLARLVEVVGPGLLIDLVTSAWRVAGGLPDALQGPPPVVHARAGQDRGAAGAPTGGAAPGGDDGRARRVAAEVVVRSAVVAALPDRSALSREALAAVAALALLEVEPALVGATVAAEVVAHVQAALDVRSGAAPVDAATTARSSRPAAGSVRTQRPPPGGPEAATGPLSTSAEPVHEGVETAPSAGDQGATADGPDRAPASGPAEAPGPLGLVPAVAPDLLGSTGWGGLLFLLGVVDDLSLPARVVDDPGRYGPVLRPVLHAIGRRTTARADLRGRPAEPDDPAVLAFAGLLPSDPPPDPLDLDLEPLVDELVQALTTRLRRPDDAAADRAAGAREPLAHVLRRRAVVDGDPGWIDVHLELDEVAVDVRRAGLDLDPGHLPWLGCVVRFRYG